MLITHSIVNIKVLPLFSILILLLTIDQIQTEVVNITIGSQVTGISKFIFGLTDSDGSLLYNKGNDKEAIDNVKLLIKNGLSLVNNHIMAWGVDDPWPDRNHEPNNWDLLDQKMHFAVDTHTIPVITLCEAPYWMKGNLHSNGSTTLLTKDDQWKDISYGSRVLDNMMDKWLHLVTRVAERYMRSPFNVRYFQVWNELKGYYNPQTNNWDAGDSHGDPNGPNAKHGYTYMYNKVYETLKHVATELKIDPSTVKIGGPYPVMVTYGTTEEQSNPSHLTKKYGNFDQRSLDAVTTWLKHKTGAEFITVDGGNINVGKHHDITDPFTASEKFADVVTWIRSLDPVAYKGAHTLPVWFAEWYSSPFGKHETISDQYNNAVKSYSIVKFIKAGGETILQWSGVGEGTNSGGTWTQTHAKGGHPLPFYYSAKIFKDYFGPQTQLHEVHNNETSVEVLASDKHALIINKQNHEITANVNGKSITLHPYDVHLMNL